MGNVLLNSQQALVPDQILQVTALLYFKEALVNQQYENCRELIDHAKNFGVKQAEISAVIKDHINGVSPGKQKANRLRSY